MKHIGTRKIKTNRLVLRAFVLDDVDDLYNNYGSDYKVNKYISFTPCKTRESTLSFIKMHIDKYDTDLNFYGWAVTLNEKVIGSVSLFNVDDVFESCELGASIGSKWWGKGIITEAVGALINFAFDEIGIHRIYASHHKHNIASGKVMIKNGMKKEGIMREAHKNPDGSFNDLVLYSILSSDR